MKNLNVKNQNGRSMIEMLGVLAIIGVLSVGGIAGYSKAMMKYRINKTIEQITLVAGNVRTFFAGQGNYDGLDSLTNDGRKIIQKAKLVPDEMWNEAGNGLENVYGGTARLSSIYAFFYGGPKDDFIIIFYGLPQEACIELATHDWSATSAYAIGNLSGVAYGGKVGHNNCITKRTSVGPSNYYVHCAASMPMETAIEYCSSADNNELHLAFH